MIKPMYATWRHPAGIHRLHKNGTSCQGPDSQWQRWKQQVWPGNEGNEGKLLKKLSKYMWHAKMHRTALQDTFFFLAGSRQTSRWLLVPTITANWLGCEVHEPLFPWEDIIQRSEQTWEHIICCRIKCTSKAYINIQTSTKQCNLEVSDAYEKGPAWICDFNNLFIPQLVANIIMNGPLSPYRSQQNPVAPGEFQPMPSWLPPVELRGS